MNTAMIIAGGRGARMNQDIPKQFLNIQDKPVIVYTLQAFQRHPEIDAICVVCIDGWQEMLRAYAGQFNITKLRWITAGGENGQESIRNGLTELAKHCDENDMVLIHDGIRPNVSQEIISGCIAACRLHGSAITVIPCVEAMLPRSFRGICWRGRRRRRHFRCGNCCGRIGKRKSAVSAMRRRRARCWWNWVKRCIFVPVRKKISRLRRRKTSRYSRRYCWQKRMTG